MNLIANDFFLVGQIVNTQGVKGEVRVVPATDDPARFELLTYVFLRQGAAECKMEIEGAWLHKKFVILKLRGVDDMNAAEKLKWAKLFIEPEKALPLEEDEYYLRDLYDMTVFDDNGQVLGVLDEVISTGANDVYSVKGENNVRYLFPAIKKCIVKVDTAAKKMIVKAVEGLSV